MAKLLDLARSLIRELTESQAPGTFPEQEDGEPLFWGFVASGDGNSLPLTRAMERLIAEIAMVLKQNDAGVIRSHTDKEWIDRVRRLLGPILYGLELDDDVSDNAQRILCELKEALAKEAAPTIREYAFGTTLFSIEVPPIAIGPVRIETNSGWLDRKQLDGGITSTTARRLRRRWAGERVKKRKSSEDWFLEDAMIGAIGACGYVCSVTTTGLGASAGELKAQTAARLALMALALEWQTPSVALDGFNLLIDRTAYRRKSLSFVPGQSAFYGSRLVARPHGPQVKPDIWATLMMRNRDRLDRVGEVLEFYLSASGDVRRPKLMNTLAQALLWFHEGCREEVDLAAIVHFAAVLDTLASGGETNGILKLIRARLGPDADQKFRTNGQTTRQAVEELYGKGRSRTIHGTNDRFGHDWSSTRAFGEQVARHCLIACLEYASPEVPDDPKYLLSA